MKVLLIHNFYRYRGGEDRYVKILEDGLRLNGHQVIRFFYDSRDIKKFSFFRKISIPFKLIHSPSACHKLEQLILKEKPDLTVAHNLNPLLPLSILKVLKKHNIPILKRLENYKFLCLNGLFLRNNYNVCESCKHGNFLHGIIHRCYQRSFFNSIGYAISEFIHRKRQTVIKSSDLFLATSSFVKSKFVEAGFPGDRIVVHPNYLDFDPLESTTPPANYAVYLGRLSQEKGLFTLLKAFQQLPDIPLKILGDGPMEMELKEFVRLNNMPNVSFEGFVDGVSKQDILKKALFLVFPSECYESFGYTIIEAFACGVPVIATDIGGNRELVKEGSNGYLYQPNDPNDLKEKARLLLSDRKRLDEMKENSLDKSKKLYKRDLGYRQLFSIFEQLTGSKK
jgi:glycosyltransferase involved in cell wall biosynthesis